MLQYSSKVGKFLLEKGTASILGLGQKDMASTLTATCALPSTLESGYDLLSEWNCRLNRVVVKRRAFCESLAICDSDDEPLCYNMIRDEQRRDHGERRRKPGNCCYFVRRTSRR